jgi:hypothetical protein
VRATSLSAGGATVLASDVPANLAFRPGATGGTLEAEAAYQATGGPASVRVGALRGNHRYRVTVDGSPAPSVDATAQGVATLALALDARRAAVLADDGLVPGQVEVDAGTPDARSDGGSSAFARSGCACGAPGAATGLVALAALLLAGAGVSRRRSGTGEGRAC